MNNEPSLTAISRVAEQFAALPQVEAIALGGSQRAGVADAGSDIDIEVYTRAEITPAERARLIGRAGGATHANVGLTFWGPSDSWIDAASDLEFDITYFDAGWMREQLDRVLVLHQPSMGYTTCFWRTVQRSQPVFDRHGWFDELQQLSRAPYPEPLRQHIILYNHPVLRNIMPSYRHQLENAVRRQDRVSANHRTAALLASYFDIIFALNRVPHPGEKRLLAFAQSECALLPTGLAADVEALVAGGPALLTHADALLDRLDELLAREGFDIRTWPSEKIDD